MKLGQRARPQWCKATPKASEATGIVAEASEAAQLCKISGFNSTIHQKLDRESLVGKMAPKIADCPDVHASHQVGLCLANMQPFPVKTRSGDDPCATV